MRLAPTLALCLAAQAAQAQTPMSPAEFEAWSTGKTLTYATGDRVWGSETHLAGRSTVDDGDGDSCQSGRWFPQGDAICFAYEDDPGPFCWRFYREGAQVIALSASDEDATPYTVTLTDKPVACAPVAGT